MPFAIPAQNGFGAGKLQTVRKQRPLHQLKSVARVRLERQQPVRGRSRKSRALAKLTQVVLPPYPSRRRSDLPAGRVVAGIADADIQPVAQFPLVTTREP